MTGFGQRRMGAVSGAATMLLHIGSAWTLRLADGYSIHYGATAVCICVHERSRQDGSSIVIGAPMSKNSERIIR